MSSLLENPDFFHSERHKCDMLKIRCIQRQDRCIQSPDNWIDGVYYFKFLECKNCEQGKMIRRDVESIDGAHIIQRQQEDRNKVSPL